METNGINILKTNTLMVFYLPKLFFHLKCKDNFLILDEARKDRIFNNLLQELRTARDLNRHLCLELHKAKMKLHLTQQHTNEHQPGSMAGRVVFI